MAKSDDASGKRPARRGALFLADRSEIRIPKTAELVANSIRRQITSGELKDGENLQPEARIIEEYAVSRPTVREAFRVLESEKLISVSRGSRGGACVHSPKAEHLARYAGFVLQSKKASYRDVYQARVMIEPPAARHVAETRYQDAPRVLREVIADAREAREKGDFGRAVARFHTQLIELTDNQTLILLSAMFDGIVGRYQSLATRSRRKPDAKSRRSDLAGLKSQEKLVALIEARDGPGAETHWRAHMEYSSRVWLSLGPGESVVDWDD